MDKKTLFREAMKNGHYGKLAWLISAFSLASEADDAWKSDPYPYRIVSNITGHYAVTMEGTLEPIEGTVADERIYAFTEEVQITPEDIPNCTAESINTTYGNWLVNYLLAVHAFGKKIPYMEGGITPSRIESIILKNFQETPKDTKARKDDEFYVDEYLEYVEAVFFLTGLTQLSVWAATKKILLPPPGLKEFKAKLLEENKDSLDELATIAKIDAALIAYDKNWIEGDPGQTFLDKGKAIEIVRKRKYLMLGAEQGLSESATHGVLVQNSLQEGWDIAKFPQLNNVLRAGSFNRGAQTQLGGVSVKWLLRASSNMNVTINDCGSRLGSYFDVTDENKSRLLGFTLVRDEGSVKVNTEEDAGKYLGERVLIRSPMYCTLDYTDYCKTCLGDRLSINPEGLSLAVSEYGSALLLIFMKAVHGKSLSTAKMNFKETIS